MILHVLKRLVFILIGFGLASIASGIVVSFIFDAGKLFNKPDVMTFLQEAVGLIALITSFIALYAALPAAVVVMIGEICVFRSKLYYAIAGCLIGTALPIAVEMYPLIVVGVFFGPVAGLIYWYFAGRNASLQPASEP